MPTFHFNHRRRDYYIDAPDRGKAYTLMLKEAAERAKKNKAEKDAKKRESKTCQCCGRSIFAEKGLIAHHGYERPAYGWQTASCWGARSLPFEVSRSELGKLLELMKKRRDELQERRKNIAAESVPVTFRYSDHTQKPTRLGYPQKSLELTRETFEAVKAANSAIFVRRSCYSFDAARDRELSEYDGMIRNISADIKLQQERYDGWKQTHRWTDAGWETV